MRVERLALALALFSLGGCTYRYTIHPEEASRAARELETREEAVVRARDAAGQDVSILVERSSWLYPLGARGEYLEGRDAMPANSARGPDPAVSAYEFFHRNTGASLVSAGAGALLGGVVLQSFYAIDEPRFAIPLAGPVMAMQKHFGYQEVCSPERMTCGLSEFFHRLAGVGNLVTFLVQVAGVGMLVSGAAVWDDRIVSSAGASATSSLPVASAGDLVFTFEPVSYGADGAGGMLTLRF
jgi:hypothetical protein